MFARRLTKAVAAGVAAVTLGIGGYAIANATSSSRPSAAASVTQTTQANQTSVGGAPAGWTSGSGTIITGAAADKAKAVAVAAYPGGTVNRVLQLSDGSYAVHRIMVGSPHHIFVSKDFKVTGTA
jgi:hypothetical protein